LEASDIKLAVGDRYTIRLEGKGGAGYSWDFAVEGEKEVIVVKVATSQPPVAKLPGDPPPALLPVSTIVTMTGTAAGQVFLILRLRRKWEVSKTPLDERTFKVTVVDS